MIYTQRHLTSMVQQSSNLSDWRVEWQERLILLWGLWKTHWKAYWAIGACTVWHYEDSTGGRCSTGVELWLAGKWGRAVRILNHEGETLRLVGDDWQERCAIDGREGGEPLKHYVTISLRDWYPDASDELLQDAAEEMTRTAALDRAVVAACWNKLDD